MTTLESILRPSYPTYNSPLRTASEWLRSSDPKKKEDAVVLLRHLRTIFSFAMPVRNEFVLSLLEQGKEAEAREELRLLQADFRELNDEARCRFGKFFKLQAFRALDKNDILVAESLFFEALEQYRYGYGVRRSHYPGINVAAILFFLAVIAFEQGNASNSSDYLRQAMLMAREALDNRAQWPALWPDDNIWFPATQGEAELILGHWKEAVNGYRVALHEANVTGFHRNSMLTQARRLLDGWKRLGAQPGEPLDRPEMLFGVNG